MKSLKVGQKAPAFTGKDENGNAISLKNFTGKKLVLYFYPKDATPTCTIQACNLRDGFEQLQKEGIAVIGVSPDDEKSHQKFKEKKALPFPLIADTSHELINKYGVWGEKKMFGKQYMGLLRTTFLIDENGIIEHIFHKPKSAQHTQEIMAFYGKGGTGSEN